MVDVRYRYANYKLSTPQKITVQQLSEILHGSPIRSTNWLQIKRTDATTLEGLSINTADDFHIRILYGFGEPRIEVEDFGQPNIFPIELVKGKEGSAFEIETKVHSLRQLYATIFLIEEGRAKEIPVEAEIDPSFDLEQKLLSDKERLQFSSVGFGSFFVLLQSLTRSGRQAIITIVALFLPAARQELIRQLRAESTKAELDVDREQFDLNMHKANALIDLQKKVDKLDKADRERVERLLNRHLHDIGITPPTNKKIGGNPQNAS